MTPITMTNSAVGLSSGSVMCRKRWIGEAPSIADAS